MSNEKKNISLKNEHLLEILNKVSDYVYLVNKDYKIVYTNKGAKEKIFNGENVLNNSIFITFPQLTNENSNIIQVFKDKKPILGKITPYIDNEGRRRLAVSSDFPIIVNNDVEYVYEISKDITGLNNISKQLIVSKENKNNSVVGLKEDERKGFYSLDSIKGISDNIKNVKDKTLIFSRSPSNVLIYGETGTGKEIIAQSIYTLINNCKKNDIPFIAQNCAAIPENLLESILFGTVKGSFTGAENKPGLFELASEGVLFLDEINSMPKSLQAKILRVLEEGKVRRVGGKDEINIEFKLISSINVRPEVLLNNNEMRKDLFYRLNILNINILPLRERKEDIPVLIDYFIKVYNQKLNKNVIGLDDDAMNYLLEYNWPGNARELKNTIESSIQITNNNLISKDAINLIPCATKRKDYNIDCDYSGRIKLKEVIEKTEIRIIKSALENTNGNISKAARDLDLPNQTLNNKINKYNLREGIDLLRE